MVYITCPLSYIPTRRTRPGPRPIWTPNPIRTNEFRFLSRPLPCI